MTWLLDLIALHVGDPDDAFVARRTVSGIATGGTPGATAYFDACRLVGEGADDPAALIKALGALGALGTGDVVDRLGVLVVWCFAAVRIDYASRQDAQRARRLLAADADAIYDDLGAAFGADALAFAIALAGEAVEQISALAAATSPLVRVETGLSLPSSLLAWDLYADPDRGAELVDRNGIGTPLVMPTAFEALSR